MIKIAVDLVYCKYASWFSVSTAYLMFISLLIKISDSRKVCINMVILRQQPGQRTMASKKFKQIYIEIINYCNLNCCFCPKTERLATAISIENFTRILHQAAPLAEKIYLHVMGEPTLHPQFDKIINICGTAAVPVDLTLNGTNLIGFEKTLFHPIIRQINISTHAAKQLLLPEQQEYYNNVLQFIMSALRIRPDLYINLRMWNLDNNLSANSDNIPLIKLLEKEFNFIIVPPEYSKQKSVRIYHRLYLHFDAEFSWPAVGSGNARTDGYCHGLSKQLAILVDGTVVPCCLDRNGIINLGNCLQRDIVSILESERAKTMLHHFKQRKFSEDLCQYCQYSTRFK